MTFRPASDYSRKAFLSLPKRDKKIAAIGKSRENKGEKRLPGRNTVFQQLFLHLPDGTIRPPIFRRFPPPALAFRELWMRSPPSIVKAG